MIHLPVYGEEGRRHVLALKLSGVDLHLEAITTYLHHDRPALQLHVAITECILCYFLESTLSLKRRTSS